MVLQRCADGDNLRSRSPDVTQTESGNVRSSMQASVQQPFLLTSAEDLTALSYRHARLAALHQRHVRREEGVPDEQSSSQPGASNELMNAVFDRTVDVFSALRVDTTEVEKEREPEVMQNIDKAFAIASGSLVQQTADRTQKTLGPFDSLGKQPAQPPNLKADMVPMPALLTSRRSLLRLTAIPDDGIGDESSSDDDEVIKARVCFNRRHKQHSGAARAVLASFGDIKSPRGANGVGPVTARCYEQSLREVRRNRLWIHQPLATHHPASEVRVAPKGRRQQWHIGKSIWHPRKVSGNSRDYYEHNAIDDLFQLDWVVAAQSHGLDRAIARTSGALRGQASQEPDRVGNVLRARATFIYNVFDYYAALNDAGGVSQGELNIYVITFNSFCAFVRACGVCDKTCSMSIIGFIWVQVNAREERNKTIDRFNHTSWLVRHEFLEALVRIAITKYCIEGQCVVSEAVTVLLDTMEATAPAEVTQNSDEFRKVHCYQALVDLELTNRKDSLAAIFDVYARANKDVADRLQSEKMMSIGEWVLLLEHLDLFRTNQLSSFGARMIFLWSRIRTAKDYNDRSEMKLRNLFFEDFLEAVVRLAFCIALPTDAEIIEANMGDAGDFLLLMATNQDVMLEFVSSRKTGWQQEPRQRVNRCVAHLIALMVRSVENEEMKLTAADGKLTEFEVSVFEKMRRQGVAIYQLHSDTAKLDGIQAASSKVRQRLVRALHRIELFAGLSADSLDVLVDAMVEAPFKQGEYVFEQDDDGDAFYFIMAGEATILREEEPGQELKVLAEIGECDYFGERALLKNERRYAGVRTKSTTMQCMCVRRDDLKTALGCSLEELVPDKYTLDKSELHARLHTVELFRNLCDTDIKKLADEMTEGSHLCDTWIFKQGDVGDCFYIITSGEAEALRAETDAAESVKIAEFKQWSSFGERALLQNETRYAGVRATSFNLKTLSINRSVFEAAVGPLTDIPILYE